MYNSTMVTRGGNNSATNVERARKGTEKRATKEQAHVAAKKSGGLNQNRSGEDEIFH